VFRIRRLTPLVSVLLLAAIAFPCSALGAPAASWAWLVARNPATTDYAPAAMDRGNAAGMVNRVHRHSTGSYSVTFPGVYNGTGGNVMVSAMNVNPRYCVVNSWSPSSAGVVAYVTCFLLNGTPADSAFSVSFLAGGTGSGQVAYLWANSPASTDYAPAADYSFNSTYGANTIHRINAGGYLVRLGGMDPDHGDIQVTAYGGVRCIVGETSSEGGDLVVGVRCPSGDAQFDLLYTKNVGLTGVYRPKAAYLSATRPTTASYTPIPEHRYSSVSMASNIARTAVGRYVVTLPGMLKGGGAHVTAAGVAPVPAFCQLASIRTTTPQKVGVRCFMANGTPVDSRFTLSYTK